MDRKKEQDKCACRVKEPITEEQEEDCNCDQALYLKELLKQVIDDPLIKHKLDWDLLAKILTVLDKEQ